MSELSEAKFVDLYLGDGFADVKGLLGQPTRVSVPNEWKEEVEELRALCQGHFEATDEPEFSLIFHGLVYRVTQLLDLNAKPLFVLNRSAVKIIPIDDIGLPENILEDMLRPTLRGLVYICGEMGTGKTSTAASMLAARLSRLGGVALTVEDPPEPLLHGEHGQGRCIQIPVSRKHGGYEEALIRALRTRADILLVGEVRDTPTAAQVVQASINGNFIFCTGHGGTALHGIERLASLAEPKIPNALHILPQGLIAVIHQTLLTDSTGFKRLKLQCLSLTGDDAPGIREKLRHWDHLQKIEQDIANQSTRSLWNDQ